MKTFEEHKEAVQASIKHTQQNVEQGNWRAAVAHLLVGFEELVDWLIDSGIAVGKQP